MTKFSFFARNVRWPENDEEIGEFRRRLGEWFASLGDSLIDSGGPLKAVSTIAGTGAADLDPSESMDGWGVLQAKDASSAKRLLGDSPLVTEYGARLEVYEMLPGVKDH